MKSRLCMLVLVLAVATINAAPEKAYPIQWKPSDCSNPLILPEQYDLSQFGKGQYRIDSWEVSEGRFNCIYIIFQSTNSLVPTSVAAAKETSFTVKDQKVVWRVFKTVVEGRPVVRKEALMPNILPRQKEGSSSDYIWLRIDAASQAILDKLTPIAENVIQNAAEPKS